MYLSKRYIKHMNYLKVMLVCLLLVQQAFAQDKVNLSGNITDQANGETLIGATVYLKNASQSIVAGSVTNVYGFYSISAPKGTYQLGVTFIGYAPIEQEVVLTESKSLNFELPASSDQLEEVVITSEDGESIDLQNTEMSVSKVKSQTIKQIPAVAGEVDVVKSIQLLPGVTNAGEAASGFNVRGGAEDQNLIMLDEAIIYNTSHLFGFFSVFNADAVKDVTLYKGAMPAKYGGRISSVMDIRQKDGNSKKTEVNGGISFISSRLAVEGPMLNDRGTFLLAGRGSYAHLLMQSSGDDSNTASFYDLNLKSSYRLNDNNKLYLSGYFGNDNITFANVLENNYGNRTGNLRWNHVFNNTLFSNLSLIYSRYDYQLDIHNFDLGWQSTIDNYNLKYDLSLYASDRIQLDFGANTIYYDFNPGEIYPLGDDSGVNDRNLQSQYAFESGLYVSMEHQWSNKFTAQYGLRMSYFNRLGGQYLNEYDNNQPIYFNEERNIYERAEASGTTDYSRGESISDYMNLEPRLALSYQLNKESSIKTSYNRSVQYIHLISNTASATPLDIWAPSGAFLEPQIGDQYSVGYFRNLRKGAYSLEVEGYYKTVDNRVDYIDGADLIAQEHLETELLRGESRSYGLELLLRKNQGDFTGWVSYTLSKTEQRTNGGNAGGPGINNGEWYNAAYDRTHDISFTGNYKLSDKWSFGTTFAFQTGRPVTQPNGQYEYNGFSVPVYSLRNEDRLPAYHRLDVSATLTPRKNDARRWKGEWVFGIYNVYNRTNPATITFGQDTETGINEATSTYIFGMIPSVTYNFKF